MNSNKQLLLKYAGMSFQLLLIIGVATFIGYWVDKKMSLSIPFMVWLIPLLAIIGTIVKVIKDTSKQKRDS
jgi:hypothetical protein